MRHTSRAKNERSIIAVLSLSGMLISLQLTLMVPALPEIPRFLGVTSNDASWLVTITLLTSTVGTPIVARMADMYGRRRMLLFSLAVLGAGSIIAAVSMSYPLVLVGRSLQGFGAAIVPIGVSLMRDLLSPKRAATGIALMSGTMGIGSAIGLPASGVLTEYGGLSAIFWASAVGALVFFILTLTLVPNSPIRTGGRFDVVGTLLFATALTAALLAISKGAEWGVASVPTVTVVLITVGGFALWVPHQLGAAEPLVQLRSSFSRPVLTTNVASFFVAVGMFANYLLTIQEARAPMETGIGLGMSGLTAGLLLIPSAVAMIALSPVAAHVLIRWGGRAGLVTGAVMILVAYTFRLFVNGGIAAVLIGTMLVGVGATFAFAAMPTLIMEAVPVNEAAAANGLNSLIRNLAGSVTTAAYGFLFVVASWDVDPTFLSQNGILTGFGAVAVCAGAGAIIAATLPRRQVRGV